MGTPGLRALTARGLDALSHALLLYGVGVGVPGTIAGCVWVVVLETRADGNLAVPVLAFLLAPITVVVAPLYGALAQDTWWPLLLQLSAVAGRILPMLLAVAVARPRGEG